MYVCICNALNEKSISKSIREGAGSADQVYRAHGVAPCCGMCADEIEDMIDDHRNEGQVIPFPAANCA